MAPLTRAAGSARPAGGSGLANAARPPPANEPEVIEIDDDDEEEEVRGEEEEGEEDGDQEIEDEDGEAELDGGSGEEVNGTDSPLEDPSVESAESEQDVEMTAPPDLFTSAGAQEALHPLRRTADRVTRLTEAFAEKLDRFKRKEHRPDDMSSFHAAYQLVQSYQVLLQDHIDEISKQNTLRRAKTGWNASRSSVTESHGGKPGNQTDEELKRLQLEADTWKLLLNLLSIDDPATRAHAKQVQETAFQNLHRYSTDREIWEQFLDADHYALECVVAMKWLEHTARSSSQDIDSLIADLEAQAERGQGLWAHGWLYTKETIKGQKRLRSWPQPLEPGDPGIALSESLFSKDKHRPLITQLDPDAITRQKLGLQKQDQFYERATWLTCWKMLRQGESWTKIRQWSQERLEGWRAVSLCGSSVDELSAVGRTPVDDGMTRMMNYRSQESWRSACLALSRDPNTEEFERAVYALLCGETEPAYKVCQSWDDYLYVFYNHTVLSRYQEFCKQFQRKLSHSPTGTVTFVPEPVGYQDLRNFLENAKSNERIAVEARNPYRTIQAAILSKNYDSFFLSVANAVSKIGNTSGKSDLIPDLSPTHVEDPALIAAQDADSLRIIAHLYIIARSLGYARSDTHFSESASVNVIGYIDNLRKAGLLDLVPLYASLLPEQSAHVVLGRILIDVVDPKERKKHAKLMEKHNIDMESVLRTQWNWVLSNAMEKEDRNTVINLFKAVRGKDRPGKLSPVKKDFIGTYVSPEDERTIRSLEWHRYLAGQWERICELGTLLYKRFFAAGSLAAARELCTRMSLSDISREILGYDLAEFPLLGDDGLESRLSSPIKASPSKKSALRGTRHDSTGSESRSRQAVMYEQSQTMRELERLILAFDALEKFAIAYEELDQNKDSQDKNVVKELKDKLQLALDYATERVDLMCNDFLVEARDETEEAELEFIRHTYLPELFLYYHNALYYTGITVSCETLVQCLNLAILVSNNASLTDSFLSSGRMKELVDALALSSAAIANAPTPKTKKKLPGGATLDIWKIKEESNDASALLRS